MRSASHEVLFAILSASVVEAKTEFISVAGWKRKSVSDCPSTEMGEVLEGT